VAANILRISELR
jgi:hypothetical protein